MRKVNFFIKDIILWEATRRKFLKILALTGAVSLVDLFGPIPFKKIVFGKEGGMTPEEMREKAIQLFKKPKLFMCSQAPLAVGQQKLGKIDWEVVRAMGSFGGGLGGNGETCGALIGAMAVIGLKYGREQEEGKENPKMWACTHELVKRFREEIVKNHSGISCRDIIGVNWKNREQVAQYYKGEKFLECARIVGDTAKLTGEILDRQT
jgi:C_GCAxxG_C_C family probable redox protein